MKMAPLAFALGCGSCDGIALPVEREMTGWARPKQASPSKAASCVQLVAKEEVGVGVGEVCRMNGTQREGNSPKLAHRGKGPHGEGCGRPPAAESHPCSQPGSSTPQSYGCKELHSANDTNEPGVGFSRVFPPAPGLGLVMAKQGARPAAPDL